MADGKGGVKTLLGFYEAFPDERACEEYLLATKHPGGWKCPRCGNTHYGWVKGRRQVQCTRCSLQESVTAGTALESTKLSLRKWLLAAYLVASDKRGVSAVRIQSELSVSYNTAYYLLQRIRAAMAQDAMGRVLSGVVEIDDAYIGSKGTTRGRGTEKAAFIAAVDRGRGSGGACMRLVPSVSGDDYRRFGYDHLCRAADIRADGWSGIASGLGGYALDAMAFDGSDAERSLPVVHHLISNFKAMVIGTYHGVTKRHMQSYMDEFTFRYTNRNRKAKLHALVKLLCLPRQHSGRKTVLSMFPAQVPLPLGKAA